MAFPGIVNTGAFTQANLRTINQNFAGLAGTLGGGIFGQQFYVDPVNGSNNYDASQAFPVKSINTALAFAVSGRGDTIFVQAGSYTENVVVSKDYVAVIGGVSGGYARPDIVPTTGVPMTVTGQGVVLVHLRMAGTAADACVQSGNGFFIADCVFDGDLTAAKGGIRLVGTAATSRTASEGQICFNYLRSNAIGIIFDTAPAINGVGSTDNRIYENVFSRNTLDLATADNGPGTYSVQFTTIGPRNQFTDKLKATYIDLTTTNGGAAADQSGTISGNFFGIDAGGVTGDTGAVVPTTTQIKMVGTAFTFSGNYGTIGLLDGRALD